MGFFNLFKKTPTVEDEVFGTLKFVDYKKPDKNHFEGQGIFGPTNEKIGYIIFSDIQGPTKEQQAFYKKIQDSYDELIVKVTPILEDTFQNWKEGFRIQDFKKEFQLTHIDIPRIEASPVTWEMMFTSLHDDHYFTVTFNNFDPDPESLQIDG